MSAWPVCCDVLIMVQCEKVVRHDTEMNTDGEQCAGAYGANARRKLKRVLVSAPKHSLDVWRA